MRGAAPARASLLAASAPTLAAALLALAGCAPPSERAVPSAELRVSSRHGHTLGQPARVNLPSRVTRGVEVEDPLSGVHLDFVLPGAADVEPEPTSDGLVF